MMDQEGPKHVGVDLLKHYCNSNEVCAFVAGHCKINMNKLLKMQITT